MGSKTNISSCDIKYFDLNLFLDFFSFIFSYHLFFSIYLSMHKFFLFSFNFLNYKNMLKKPIYIIFY